MKKVTRNIDPAQARDLLERVPRACVAFSSEAGPLLAPVELSWQEGRYRVRFFDSPVLDEPREAVLLVDEGVDYFDLRALYIRGELRPSETGWYELIHAKTVAWDYGKLRELDPDEPGGEA